MQILAVLITTYPKATKIENNEGSTPGDLLWRRKMDSNMYEKNLDDIFLSLKEELGPLKPLKIMDFKSINETAMAGPDASMNDRSPGKSILRKRNNQITTL